MSDNHSHDNYPPGFDPRVLDNEDEIIIPERLDEDDDSADLADEFLGDDGEYVPEEDLL